MHYLHEGIDFVLHIDTYLTTLVAHYGFWTYLALFLVIFCETGLVITPFLPGDSLLFAAGSIAAQPGNPLQFSYLLVLLLLASFCGNQVNFWIGRTLGEHILAAKKPWLLNKKHLQNTHAFYEKHGGKTLILARFLPIVRTFAPFVAGLGTMEAWHFLLYNLLGAVLWIGGLLSLGYFLGSIPIIKNNFTLVIYALVLIPLVPAITALFCRKSITGQT